METELGEVGKGGGTPKRKDRQTGGEWEGEGEQ